MEISGGIDICQMSLPTGATAILLLVCILSLLSTNCPAQKNCAGQRDIKSEQYSFVCVLRADRLPGPDNPMQSPRRHARFPVASTPAGEPCRFHCQKSHVPDVPIRFLGQGHGAASIIFSRTQLPSSTKVLADPSAKTRITTGAP